MGDIMQTNEVYLPWSPPLEITVILRGRTDAKESQTQAWVPWGTRKCWWTIFTNQKSYRWPQAEANAQDSAITRTILTKKIGRLTDQKYPSQDSTFFFDSTRGQLALHLKISEGYSSMQATNQHFRDSFHQNNLWDLEKEKLSKNWV